MFGLKIFAKAKTKKFESDKDRKRYYAIQEYYKKKNKSVNNTTQKTNPPNHNHNDF